MVTTSQRMPAVFLGHGSPLNTFADNRYTQAWAKLGAAVARPRAILAISAHWYVGGVAVTAMEKPRTIHDFGGFPKALFDFQYPAAGDAGLAQRVRKLLEPLDVGLDQAWGLDHGTWSVLAHVYPRADVPVVQLSMDATKPPSFHYDLGRKLAPLRDEGVLIAGSGNVVHNLRMIRREDDAPAFDWAERFEARVETAIGKREHAALVDYGAMGEDARLAVPTPEHYLPLLYILALQGDEPASFPVDGIQNASISMLSVVVGAI